MGHRPPSVPPTCSVGGPYSGTAGVALTFSCTAADVTGFIKNWRLAFGDNAVLSGKGNLPTAISHIYTSAGGFTAKLTVTNNANQTASQTTSVTIASAVPAPPATFSLTVTNGSGSGVYAAGVVVAIVANPPPTGESFSQWTGATVQNPASASTTLVMPAGNTTVTANYTTIPPPPPPPPPPLTVTCPSPIALTSPDGNGVVATFTPTASGGTAPVTVTASPASGTIFPVGVTTVQVRATDSGIPQQTASCSFTVSVTTTPPPPPPPSGGLIQSANLIRVGAFRVPQTAPGDPSGQGFSFGGWAIGVNPATPSLYLASLGQTGQKIAEISIPIPSSSTTLTDLPTATFLQSFADPTENHYKSDANPTFPDGLGGLLVLDGVLHLAGYIYYDALASATGSQAQRSLNLSTASFSGWQAVGTLGQGFVNRAMCPIPSTWQTALGGRALVAGAGLPVVGRESWGPCAVAYDPANVRSGGPAPAPALPLLYYTGSHPTLGDWNNTTVSDPLYNMTTDPGGGIVIVPGWNSLLAIGRTGTGIPKYGEGTDNLALNGTIAPDGSEYVYDPDFVDAKGTHAYPYTYFVWAYDLNDLAAVKAGTKNPWDVVPYATWALGLPFPEKGSVGLAATVDPTSGLIYVSQIQADPGFFQGPIIHVFRIA